MLNREYVMANTGYDGNARADIIRYYNVQKQVARNNSRLLENYCSNELFSGAIQI